MKTKLTLSVKPEAVVIAKRLARKRHVSVSSLFEQWSLNMAGQIPEKSFGSRLRGRWKKRFPENDPRLEYLLEKHTSQ